MATVSVVSVNIIVIVIVIVFVFLIVMVIVIGIVSVGATVSIFSAKKAIQTPEAFLLLGLNVDIIWKRLIIDSGPQLRCRFTTT